VDYYTAWEQESGHWVLVCMREEEKFAKPAKGSSASSSTQPGQGYSKGYGGAQPGKGYSKGYSGSQPAKGRKAWKRLLW